MQAPKRVTSSDKYDKVLVPTQWSTEDVWQGDVSSGRNVVGVVLTFT